MFNSILKHRPCSADDKRTMSDIFPYKGVQMTDPFDTDNAIDISRVSTMAGGLEQQLDAPELAAENERLQYELDEQCRLLGAGGEREAKLASDNQRLREALKMLRAAMLRAVDIGCVDHLDCADDHGAFWHNALDTSKEFAS